MSGRRRCRIEFLFKSQTFGALWSTHPPKQESQIVNEEKESLEWKRERERQGGLGKCVNVCEIVSTYLFLGIVGTMDRHNEPQY